MKLVKTIFLFLLILSIIPLFPPQKAFGAEVNHYYEENTTCTNQTDNAGAVMLTVTDSTEFEFVDGRSYLIVAKAFYGNDSTAENTEVWMEHGTTIFAGSVQNTETNLVLSGSCSANNAYNTYFFFTVWSPVGATQAGEDITLNIDNRQSGAQYEWDTVTIFVLEISEEFTEDTDWHYDFDGSDNTLGTTWNTTGDASVTFTPDANNEEWLIMCTTEIDTASATVQHESRINLITDSVTLITGDWEGEDTGADKYVQTGIIFATMENTSHNIECEAQGSSASGTRLSNALFIMNIDKFNQSEFAQDLSTANAMPNSLTEIHTLDYTPTTTGNTWVISNVQVRLGNSGDCHQCRFQIDDTTQPTGQDAGDIGNLWEGFDNASWFEQKLLSLDTSTHNIDVDATDGGSPNILYHEQLIGAISMELPASSPVYNIDLLDVYQSSSTTLGSGTAVCLDVDTDTAQTCSGKLQRGLDYRFEIEVDNSGATGSPSFFEIRNAVASADVLGTIVSADILDSGCSTNTNWSGVVVSTTANNTAGTTCSISNGGTVEYWAVINIDDDAEGNSSLDLFVSDGTDTNTSSLITFNFQRNDDEEDPITVTDNQEFDISIIIEDNMSLTDVEEFDVSILLDDPLTITDIMTPVHQKQDDEEDTMTLTDNQEFDISIIIEDNMSLTDLEEFDTSIRLENPITITDTVDANKEFADVEEDPLTLTDNQRFDTSIIVEDSMRMIDDERFDTSIRLDNPITMTDTTAITRVNTEIDPMTITDDQRFGITKTPEDPVTMTDNLELDTSSKLDNPMVFTEILTLLCTGVCSQIPIPPTPPSGGGGGGQPIPLDPDSDGDGLIDSVDQCPNEFGTLENNGCPEELSPPLLDFTFDIPFELNELEVVDDFIILETTSPQPQIETLTIRWLSDEPITLTSVQVSDSPFEINVENIPVEFGNEQFGFTQTQLLYTVQEPATVCTNVFTFDCVDEVTYEIPVIVSGESDGKIVTSQGTITIDNSGRVNPFFYSLLLIIAVPLVGFLLWKRKQKPSEYPKGKFKLIKKREAKKPIAEKPVVRKAGSTKRLLRTKSSNVLGKKTK